MKNDLKWNRLFAGEKVEFVPLGNITDNPPIVAILSPIDAFSITGRPIVELTCGEDMVWLGQSHATWINFPQITSFKNHILNLLYGKL